MQTADAALEAAYKQHSAKLLAVLVRIFGTRNLELAEDVLQEAFRKALVTWTVQGIPDNPAAWLMTAAKNQAIDVIRAQRTQRKFSEDLSRHLESDWTLSHTVEQEFSETKIQDHQLRMIFMCTSAELSPENRVPLILRSLCGLSVAAISRALFVPEATIKKRLLRSREKLAGHKFVFPPAELLLDSMDSVHTVIYLLFNEGFLSSEEGPALKLELCREAIHLSNLLVSEPRVVNGDTLGLVSLMNFHLARAATRLDDEGAGIPLDLQDRSRWDLGGIALARDLLRLAPAIGPGASGRYLVEARIAAEHCRAETFDRTDWPAIVRLYDELVEIVDSPIARLNRAVAVGYAGEIERAIAEVLELGTHSLLVKSHLPTALLAHLHAKLGDEPRAREYARISASLGGTPHEQRVMLLQVERLLAGPGRPA